MEMPTLEEGVAVDGTAAPAEVGVDPPGVAVTGTVVTAGVDVGELSDLVIFGPKTTARMMMAIITTRITGRSQGGREVVRTVSDIVFQPNSGDAFGSWK